METKTWHEPYFHNEELCDLYLVYNFKTDAKSLAPLGTRILSEKCFQTFLHILFYLFVRFVFVWYTDITPNL